MKSGYEHWSYAVRSAEREAAQREARMTTIRKWRE